MRRRSNLKITFDTLVLKVRVFPTEADLHAGLAKEFGETVEDQDRIQAATRRPLKGRKHIAVWFAGDQLSLEIVAHESVHVAYAIGRWGVNPWQHKFEAEEEERLAYPVGAITAALVRELKEAGWSVSV